MRELSEAIGWPVLIQEQEAYLLPGIKALGSFKEGYRTVSGVETLWTPGPTPGSCVIYAPYPQNVLFCGRLLTSVGFDNLPSLRSKKTFHWTTQKKSIEKLLNWIPLDPLPSLALGFQSSTSQSMKLFPWKTWNKQKN